MKKIYSKTFFYIKRFLKYNYIVVIILTGMFLLTFFLSNKKIERFSNFSNVLNNKLDEKIINRLYNNSLEGTVLDNIFDFDATVIFNKHLNILHKEVPISNDIFIVKTNLDNYNQLKNSSKQKNNPSTSSSLPFTTTSSKHTQLYQSKIMSLDDFKETQAFNVYSSQQSNRFQGLIEDFKKQSIHDKNKKLELSVYKNTHNWNKNSFKDVLAVRPITNHNILNISDKNSSINMNIVKYSETKHKLDSEIVKDFSKDPLKSVIEKVLIPNGIPKTPANVNAIAVSMGLPSGSLGSSDALASSLGVSVDDLSDPNIKLPSKVVLSINKNKNYIGKLLDINNTTLSDYYGQTLKNNYFSNIGNN